MANSAPSNANTGRRSIFIVEDHPGADELMVTSQIYDHAARLHSYEIAAGVLAGAAAAAAAS